jgi:hypothetical protein
MNIEFIKKIFDAGSVIRSLVSETVTISGNGGEAAVTLFGHSSDVINKAAASLNILANDEDARRGIDVEPQTVIGSIGVIDVIKELSTCAADRTALVCFHEDGWGEDGLLHSIESVKRDLNFEIASVFARSVMIHEHYGQGVSPRSYDCWQKNFWESRRFICYRTSSTDDSLASSVTLLLALAL